MKHKLRECVLVGVALAAMTALVVGEEIHLPQDVSRLRASPLPGYALAQQKCGICHSADYINYQPPGMNQQQWTAEVRKMQQSYGAPLDDADIARIGAYLAVTYGSARADDAAVVAASASPAAGARAAQAGSAIDVPALLGANACLTCHATDRKIVGPAFHAIAEKYRGKADAQAMVAASIRNGGVGKWGEVPMPPMSNLSEAQAMAVAAFVLRQ